MQPEWMDLDFDKAPREKMTEGPFNDFQAKIASIPFIPAEKLNEKDAKFIWLPIDQFVTKLTGISKPASQGTPYINVDPNIQKFVRTFADKLKAAVAQPLPTKQVASKPQPNPFLTGQVQPQPQQGPNPFLEEPKQKEKGFLFDQPQDKEFRLKKLFDQLGQREELRHEGQGKIGQQGLGQENDAATAESESFEDSGDDWDGSTTHHQNSIQYMNQENFQQESLLANDNNKTILSGIEEVSKESKTPLFFENSSDCNSICSNVLKEHTAWVRSVAFSPDGKTFVTGSDDERACLWDASTGNLLHELKGHGGWVHSVAYNVDGNIILTGSDSGTVCLWSVRTGKLFKMLECGNGLYSATYSPDGSTVLTGLRDNTACLWSVLTGKLLKVFKGHSGIVCSVAYSADGKTVLTGSHDSTACAWDALTGELLKS